MVLPVTDTIRYVPLIVPELLAAPEMVTYCPTQPKFNVETAYMYAEVPVPLYVVVRVIPVAVTVDTV